MTTQSCTGSAAASFRILVEKWRANTLAIVTGQIESTPSQRRLAWRFLKQHGAGA